MGFLDTLMGGGDDPMEDAMATQEEFKRMVNDLSLPELERLKLEAPELVGLLESIEQESSAMEDISTDPRLQDMQMQALESLRQRSETGLTAEDKFAMEELLGDVANQEMSQRSSIEQEMARKGMDDSGQSLMMKLQAKQAGANQARAKARDMAAQAANQRQSALSQMQQAAGQMEGADFARQAGVASAKDRIAAANTQNRQQVAGQNLSARQAIANQRADLSNQQQMYNKSLAEKNYENEIKKLQLQGGAYGDAAKLAGSQKGSSGLAGLGTIVGGVAGAMYGGPAGASAGASAGGAIGGAFGAEDGGIAGYEDGGVADARRPADIKRDMESEYKQAEDKQHSQFKKKYMKKVRDELMEVQETAHKEVTRSPKYEDGGTVCAEDGSISFTSDGMGDIVDGDSFERDRVDAKLNSGEAVLNVPQQQRFMDLVRGKISTDELGDEDIVEGVPSEYSEELNEDLMEGSSDEIKGLKKLLQALGRS